MSKIREAKLNAVNATTIVAGARALGIKATANSIEFGQGGRFEILKNGSLKGDFDFVTKVAGVDLPKSIAQRPEAMIGILAQAGSISRIGEQLSANGWSVESDYRGGKLVATRGSERVDFAVGRDGKTTTEGTNFQGNSCSMVLDSLLDLLGTYNVTNETSKVDPTQVIRTVV